MTTCLQEWCKSYGGNQPLKKKQKQFKACSMNIVNEVMNLRIQGLWTQEENLLLF